VRIGLTYDRDTTAPASVLVKYPSDDPGSRDLALAMGMYELETRFYRDVAPMFADTAVPLCYAAELDEDCGTFTLVLEDLTGRTKPGDVLTAASLEDCDRTLATLVGLQASTWNSPALATLGWLANSARTEAIFDALPAGMESFLARFGDLLDPAHVNLFESVLPSAGEWVRSWSSPTVLQHGDFRSDNVLYPLDSGAGLPTVIDFQTVRLGPPGLDPAYFIGSSLPTDVRQVTERDLVADYHKRLQAAGVEDFDFDQCWASYREGAMYAVFLFVGMAGRVESTERGDRVIVDQIRRYADMALDLDSPRLAGLA
jgi:hypothetical protein